MDDPKGGLSAQVSLTIAYTIFAAVGALLWIFPKFGEGGFFWTLSLPLALIFIYTACRSVAPASLGHRDVQFGFAIPNLVMWIIGRRIMNASLPESDLSWSASAMSWFTRIWLYASIIAVLTAFILRRISPRPPEHLVEEPPAEDASSDSSASDDVGDSTDSALEDKVPHELAPSAPAAPLAPSRPALVTATLSGASFPEVMTLLEVASSLDATESPASLLLEISPTGMTLSSAGLEIGTVSGTWSGTQALRARLSAQEARRELLSFSPAPATLTVQIRLEGESVVELRADRSVQRVSLAAARA